VTQLRKTDAENHRRPGWFVKVGDRETIFLNEMLRELQERVGVPGKKLKELCDDLDVEAVIVCGARQGKTNTTPALSLPTEFLEWAVEMGASINVDLVL
jgi:hypothetical protein